MFISSDTMRIFCRPQRLHIFWRPVRRIDETEREHQTISNKRGLCPASVSSSLGLGIFRVGSIQDYVKMQHDATVYSRAPSRIQRSTRRVKYRAAYTNDLLTSATGTPLAVLSIALQHSTTTLLDSAGTVHSTPSEAWLFDSEFTIYAPSARMHRS